MVHRFWDFWLSASWGDLGMDRSLWRLQTWILHHDNASICLCYGWKWIF